MRRQTPEIIRSRPIIQRAVACAALTLLVALTSGAGGGGIAENPNVDAVLRQADRLGRQGLAWYQRTPPGDRIAWGGLAACALLGLGVTLDLTVRLRRKKILPPNFVDRFHDRLVDGKLDKGKGSDLCELNPSPAARIALAAVSRWERPAADMERAVALARQVEAERLRGHVGTLRRVAAMAPLVGLLGTLMSAGRALSNLGPDAQGQATAWAPAIAQALGPLTAGVALAILALVAYDGLIGKIEGLVNALDRLGAETIDAIAMSGSTESRPHPIRTGPGRTPHQIARNTE